MPELTDVLSAISHPTRRAIISHLATSGPTRFTHVAAPLGVSLNAVTKHLEMLDRAGLIARDKQGREVFISLCPEPLHMVATWTHEYERFWNKKLDTFEKHFKNKKTHKK